MMSETTIFLPNLIFFINNFNGRKDNNNNSLKSYSYLHSWWVTRAKQVV